MSSALLQVGWSLADFCFSRRGLLSLRERVLRTVSGSAGVSAHGEAAAAPDQRARELHGSNASKYTKQTAAWFWDPKLEAATALEIVHSNLSARNPRRSPRGRFLSTWRTTCAGEKGPPATTLTTREKTC